MCYLSYIPRTTKPRWLALATLPVALSCFSPLAGAQTALSAEECLALYDGTDCVGKRFTIGNRTELEAMQGNNCYKLIDNIDLAGENWSPQPGNFTGTVCSNGHAIQNMNIIHSNGANSGFHARSGDGVRMELVLELPRVMVSGSTSNTGVGFLFVSLAGNGRVAITLRQAYMETTGSNLFSAGGLAGDVISSTTSINNHLSLTGEGIQINDKLAELTTDGYVSLGLASNSGSDNNTVTLHQLHGAAVNSDHKSISGGIAYSSLGNNVKVTLSECSNITLISKYSVDDSDAYLSFGIALNTGRNTHIDLRALEGASWYNGTGTVRIREALLMGGGLHPANVTGTLLVANSGPDGYALIDVIGGNVNCSSVYWDISRNGRTKSGCKDNTGHGVYTHTAEGWNEIWPHHGIDNGDRVPGERQLTPAGGAPVLLTYQYFRGHPYIPEYEDGHFYKNESGGIEFKKQGTGPLVLRTLSLNNTGNLTLHFREPKAYDHPDDKPGNHTTPYQDTWAWKTGNNISLVLYSWHDNLIHWLNIGNDGQASEPRNLTVAGKPLALDSNNLFTYNSTTGYIHHYQLNQETMDSYLPGSGFNTDANPEDIAFAIGKNNTLIQAVRNGGQVDINPVSFNNTRYTPVSIDYQQPGEFQLLLNPDDDTSGTARVIPRQATLVDNYQLTLKGPNNDWNLYSYQGQPQPAASASYSFNIVITTVPVTPTTSTAVASGTASTGSSTSMASTSRTPSPTDTPSEATSGSGYQTVAGGVTMVGLAVLAGLLNGAR